MNTHLSQTTIGLGIAGSLALALASPVNAQSSSIPVTGGRAVFNDTQIFVPIPNSIDNRTVVFEGGTPDSVFIQTSQGNIPLNAKFTSDTLPEIFSTPGIPPRIGDTGRVFGRLTFRGFTAAGEPGLFANIPTNLNFQITSGNFDSAFVQRFTQYQTQPTTLTQVGTIATPVSFTTTVRTLPIILVQFQRGTRPPESQTLTNVRPVTTIPASAYTTEIPGDSFFVSFKANLTGGSVAIPTPPGLNSTGTPSSGLTNVNRGFNPSNPTSTIVIDRSVTINVGTSRLEGFSQVVPVLPTIIVVGVFRFVNVRSGTWFDPPLTESFEYEMIPRNIPIGIASRVFPGITGRDIASDAVFTAISGFPKDVDADDRFTVSVEGKVLGEFSPGDTLKFSDYAKELGNLLTNGGVKKFTVSSIKPAVDSANPRAFPLKLEFSTPTASFEMRAIDSSVAQTHDSSDDKQAVKTDSDNILSDLHEEEQNTSDRLYGTSKADR